MTEGGHQDHVMQLNVVKDLTRPNRRGVLYVIAGGGWLSSGLETPGKAV